MPVVMPEPTSKNALHGQTFMLDFSYPQNHLPPTSPADFKNRTPIPYPSTTSLEPKRPRPFPTLAEVNDTTITECYIRYIIASDPNLDDSAYTTYRLARKFTAVPRTEGKVFQVWELFKLVSQLDGGKIKNWSQLVGKLGVEDPTGRPQYAQRVKRWMQSNKIDEFFDFLLRGDQRISSIAVRTPVTDYLVYHPHSQYPAGYPTATVHPQNYSICEDRRRSFDVQFGVHASVHPKKRMRTSFDSHFSPMPVFSNGNYTSYHQGPSRQFAHRSDCVLPPLRKTTARSRSPTLNSDGTFTVSPVLEPSLNFSLPVPRLPTSPYGSPVLGSCAEFPSPLIPGLTAGRRFEDSYAPYSHEIRASIPASSDVEPLRTRIMENEQKTVELQRLLEDANREKIILKEREDLQKMQQFQTFDPRRIR